MVSGESPTVYDSSFFQIQWGKNYITLISQTFYGNSFQVKVSELALEALSPFQYNMSFESNTTNISPISLMLNEVEVEYVFTEFTSNPFSWSPSAANISTNVVGLNFYISGAIQQVNVTNGLELILPIVSALNGTSTPFNSSDYTAQCLVWDDVKQSFSPQGCVVSSFGLTQINCVCSSFGFFAGALKLKPSSQFNFQVNAVVTKWLPQDQQILLTIFGAVMIVIVFMAAALFFRGRSPHSNSLQADYQAEVAGVLASPTWQATKPSYVAVPVGLEEEDLEEGTEEGYGRPYHKPGIEKDLIDAKLEEDEENMELVEWTGDRGQTRLARIARGAGERGVYGVTSTIRHPGYTSSTFIMRPRLKKSDSNRSDQAKKRKELHAKADIQIHSQSSVLARGRGYHCSEH